MIRREEFDESAQVDAAIKEKLDLVSPEKKRPLVMQNYIVPDPVPGSPMAECPELIQGSRLSSRLIRWTKDLRVLHGNCGRHKRKGTETWTLSI